MNSPSLANSKITEFNLAPIDGFKEELPGYYVTSTASINVEDIPAPLATSVEAPIADIAEYLVKSQKPQIVVSIHGYATKRSDAKNRYQKIYKYANSICKQKNSVFLGYCWPAENPSKDDPEPSSGKSSSFKEKLLYALQSLPTMLIGVFISSLVLGLITAFLIIGSPSTSAVLLVSALVSIVSIFVTGLLLKLGKALSLLPLLPIWMPVLGLLLCTVAIFSPINIQWLLVILLIVFAGSFSIILALLALRLSTYLRDSYRSANYGVLDLVELFRQLDQAVFEAKLIELLESKYLTEELLNQMKETREGWEAADNQRRMELWEIIDNNSLKKVEIEQEVIRKISKIKVNFIGHSMGCFVVTNTLRILSDVFDSSSIKKKPSSDIGRVFTLGRLLLVAPDISLESIMPRRTNFLRSSLRRCEEAYVFSNEGDLALRIASTAANYISFPSRTRYGGYRLGNVTAKHYENQKDRHNKRLEDENYGIVNFHDGKITQQPYSCLEIRASNQEHRKPEEICPLDSTEKEKTDSLRTVPVADLFTYFDCTDYVDIKTDNLDGKDAPGTENSKEINPKGVVSYAIRKSALNLWDYVGLSKAYFFSSGTQHINVHGGFFDGKFSQKVMYQLAFLGFKGFLESLKPDAETSVQLSELSTECRNKQIQVVLSPPLLEKLS